MTGGPSGSAKAGIAWGARKTTTGCTSRRRGAELGEIDQFLPAVGASAQFKARPRISAADEIGRPGFDKGLVSDAISSVIKLTRRRLLEVQFRPILNGEIS